MSNGKIRFEPATGIIYVCDPRVKGFVMCEPEPEPAPATEPATEPAPAQELNDFQRLTKEACGGDEDAENRLRMEIRNYLYGKDENNFLDYSDESLAKNHGYDEDSYVWVSDIDGAESGQLDVDGAWREAIDVLEEKMVEQAIEYEDGTMYESPEEIWTKEILYNASIEIRLAYEVREALEVLENYRGGFIPPNKK